jgi:ABC-2 type transport system ATP-binding protein
MEDIINAQNLTKTFGNFTAVNGVTFNVPKGEIFAFLGPNGAGKTTTIKMLTTLLHPTTGTIKLNNVDSIAHPEIARKTFGIVFQDPSLDDELTAMENMEFHAVLYKVPHKEIKERIEKFLNLVELWDKKNDLVKTFSGGMKRRLEIARGLLHKPEILFLDEPTQGLDPQTRNKIWEYLQNLNKETQITIFFTTHYMEEAEQIAQRIAIMDHGKIIETGTAKALMEKTQTKSLEEAFLKFTGTAIRDEEASGIDKLRGHARMWRSR